MIVHLNKIKKNQMLKFGKIKHEKIEGTKMKQNRVVGAEIKEKIHTH